MSGYLTPKKKVWVADLVAKKAHGEKWAMLTAYDYATARTFAAAGIECLLVGDSAANVVYGYETTNHISLDEMAYLGAAVVRGAGNALVVIDLPFGTYEASDEQCVRTATELVRRTGANMVKLEGGSRIAPRIRALKQAGLAVCAHVGFTPQSVDNLSGFKVQGRDDSADQLRADTEAVTEAGADMAVFEMVPADLATELTAACPAPVIGIGAGAGTDAQVLVWHDMADFPAGDHRARFVQRFGSIGADLAAAAADYKRAVHTGQFPAPEHTF
ncbi:3-methyl-2-oxobutanoate hydroxymethyltransferase [Corynebacterium lujinxingii]|uniref:3-methyl-2-oxobutanoate hydroxymethyltransferase n=1 Tax=Corynebacterium lujinxingii TaxID=2763010 RepID=A0A7H0JYB0_9CORY|nr:3-methyl-2-oxobutanoate hydroxymethyltransferase [Corynebacterium lujinxingii]MBC3178274.1 3-methyl-2-oxobutanoate hydroxymethyltransferase [Corynebacterium lujinxingii]NNO10848.1 3-methyl-2-oxobutanoate hydroxymethyltransferase [Corynebacterium lujinxingii]QNP90026.1 3-methyl-2-oxobutanoate hydroxymethyltransferase [Corynebacterium lujinxingii]